MSLTPEQIEALKEALRSDTDLIKELIDPIIKSELTGVASRQVKEMKALREQLTGINTRLETIPDYSDDYLDEKFTTMIDKYAASQPDEPVPIKPSDSVESNSEIAKLRAEMEQRQKALEEASLKERQTYAARFDALQKERDAAEANRIQAEKQSRLSAAQTEALKAISGQVISGKESRALKALIDEGKITYDEESNSYGIRGRDKFDVEDVFTPINAAAIAPIIQSDFSEYVAPRSGGGTGAAPSNKSQPTSPSRPLAEYTEKELFAMTSDQRFALLSQE